MKKQNTGKGLMMTGSFRKSGVTFYMRQGQVIARSAHSHEKRSCTLPQFVQRMRMRHTIALWQTLSLCRPMFTGHRIAYQGFASLANRLPAVYVSQKEHNLSLLMPDLPVSDGTLPTVMQRLGVVDGAEALITNLKTSSLHRGEVLRLYTAEQHTEGRTPRVRFNVRTVPMAEFVPVDGCLALTGDEFADEMKGWALVRVDGDRCSAQTIVTRCTYYQPYTSDEALKAAAESYGGLTV